MGGSSIICPGADPDSAYLVESRSFVAWLRLLWTVETASPRGPRIYMVRDPRSVCGRHASHSDPVRKRPFAGSCAQNRL